MDTCSEAVKRLGDDIFPVEGSVVPRTQRWEDVVAEAKGLYLEQGPEAYLNFWNEHRRNRGPEWLKKASAWWRRKLTGFLVPDRAIYPWHYIRNEEKTAGVIRNFIEEVEHPRETKKELAEIDRISQEEDGQAPPRPIEMIRSWLDNYNTYPTRVEHTIQDGFVDLFNELQFQRAIDMGVKRGDRVIIEVAKKDASGNISFEERMYLDHEIHPYLHRLRTSRQNSIGKPTMLPDRSLAESVEDGQWKRGSLPELAVDQAELYTKLLMVKKQIEKVESNFSMQGRELPKKVKQLLESIDVALVRESHMPSMRAFTRLAGRELHSQYQGWRSKDKDVETIKDHVFYRVLNPSELARIGVLESNDTKRWLRFFLSGRFGILSILLGGGTLTFHQILDTYQEWFSPVNNCARKETDAEFDECVNKALKIRFSREFYLTYSDENHIPFRDASGELLPEHRAAIAEFWKSREEELDRRRAMARFGKPTREEIEKLRADYNNRVKKEELAENATISDRQNGVVQRDDEEKPATEQKQESSNAAQAPAKEDPISPPRKVSTTDPQPKEEKPQTPEDEVKPKVAPPNPVAKESENERESMLQRQALFYVLEQHREKYDRLKFLDTVLQDEAQKEGVQEEASKEREAIMAELKSEFDSVLQLQRQFFGDDLPDEMKFSDQDFLKQFMKRLTPGKIQIIPKESEPKKE